MENKNFLAAKFGIEVEFTGITRRQAAKEFIQGSNCKYKNKSPNRRRQIWRSKRYL